jgi:hypothetical protein
MKLLFTLVLATLGATALAQPRLPPCPADQSVRWHACQGRYVWPSGDVYVGEWQDDKRHGRGSDTFASGHRYTGEFQDGQRHGQGTYTFPNGESYVGEWREGKRHGSGTNIFPDGERYVGEWRQGERHGLGVAYRPDGSVLRSGRWADDRWVQHAAPDTTRFPFQAPVARVDDEARRRAEAVAQAERRRRQELEQELAEERRRRIEAEQKVAAEESSSGTGFAVAAGLVVTNQHVVAGCTRLDVLSPDGRRTGVVVDADEGVDLALVRVTGLGGGIASLRRPGSVRLGESAYAFGFPLSGLLSDGGNFTNGVVSSLRGLRESANEIQITTPVQPGNSGGALIDAAGHVIGVIVGKLDATAVSRSTGDIPQNVNFAVSMQALLDFLGRNRVPFRATERSAPVETVQIADAARAFTHRIVCIGAPDTASPAGAGQAAEADTTVELLNEAREEIFEIRISPVTAKDWGPDLLGDGTLAPGGRFTLQPPVKDGCRYDVYVKYRSGRTEEERDQDFCTLTELKFRGR